MRYVILVSLICLYNWGCSDPSTRLPLSVAEPKITELQRISNQSKSVDAVLAIKETDATVATPTEVYLLAHGHTITGEPTFRADYTKDVRMTWNTNTKLTISGEKARAFLNFNKRKVDLDSGATCDIEIVYEIKTFERP